MARMGHASARAALIYQHVDPEREREIAQALSKKIEAERPLRDLAREWHEAETDDRRVGTNVQCRTALRSWCSGMAGSVGLAGCQDL
jgi:hypothetical protein